MVTNILIIPTLSKSRYHVTWSSRPARPLPSYPKRGGGGGEEEEEEAGYPAAQRVGTTWDENIVQKPAVMISLVEPAKLHFAIRSFKLHKCLHFHGEETVASNIHKFADFDENYFSSDKALTDTSKFQINTVAQSTPNQSQGRS